MKHIRIRHFDCAGLRRAVPPERASVKARDAVRSDFNSLIDAATGSQFFPQAAVNLVTTDDWRDMITAAVRGRDCASTPARRSVLDALKIAAAPARDVRRYFGLSEQDRAGVDAASYLSNLLETAASPAGPNEEEGSEAEFSNRSPASVVDGASMRVRARANGARAIAAMQSAADAFWSTAPKPSANQRVDDINAVNAAFWR